MNKLIIAVLVILCVQGCSDSDKVEVKDPIVGSWTIVEAIKDGISYDVWIGLKIVFKQTDLGKGTYVVIDTPSESIWKSSGMWQTLEIPNAINLDNSLDATYILNKENLQFSFLISEGVQVCSEPPCILIVNGQWFFNTHKD